MAEQAVLAARTGRAARGRVALAALAGAAAALGQAPVSLPWVTLAALFFLCRLLADAATPRGAALLGWGFGTGYFALALSWIVEPFLVDAARHAWMAPFALIGLAAGLALFWGAAAAAAALTARGRWSRALGLAVWLAAAELARSYLLTGFPWALIGHVWIGWAPMQLAAWTGPHGLTLLTVLAAALAEAAWRTRPPAAAAVLLPFGLLYGAAGWQAARPVPAPADPLVVRLVQPNAAQHLKWRAEHVPEFFGRQLGYTMAAADRRPDLVIWPETAIPYVLDRAGPALDRIVEAAAGVPVVLGLQRLDGARAYNSLIVLDEFGDIAALYDKHHLVPFGEYVPGGAWIERLGLGIFVGRGGYGYSAGPGARLIDLGPRGRVLPLICYEAIFPQDLHAAPERPDWLLQITNDAWFGRLSGPYQHLAQARLRAVEQGLPLVRAANTGVSAVIDPRGRVTASLALDRAGYVDAPLPGVLPAPLYARTGDLPALLLLLAGALGLSVARRRARH